MNRRFLRCNQIRRCAGIILCAVSLWIHYRRQISAFTEVGDRLKNFLPFDSKADTKENKGEK